MIIIDVIMNYVFIFLHSTIFLLIEFSERFELTELARRATVRDEKMEKVCVDLISSIVHKVKNWIQSASLSDSCSF